MNYKVAEKFVSINGEGTRSGQLAVFIRFCGCNLNCGFCDTSWANDRNAAYEEMSGDGICDYILSTGIRNVTLTGGEPLLQPGIYELIESITELDLDVEIETNGSINLERFMSLKKKPAFTMDYKLPGSGMESFMVTDNFRLLTMKDTVKFVAGDKEDLVKFKEIIEKYKLTERCNVYLSPVYGKINLSMMVDFMKDNRLNRVNMQLQMHKIIWDSDKRGV